VEDSTRILNSHIVPPPEYFAVFVYQACSDGDAAFFETLVRLFDGGFEAGVVYGHDQQRTRTAMSSGEAREDRNGKDT
jgi:hypothetical protein